MPRSAKPLLTFAALSLTACATAGVNTQRDEDTIRTMAREWGATIAAHDVDRWASYYADDAVLLVPNMPPARGRDAIRALGTELMGMPGLAFTGTPMQVTVARAGDMATEVGNYRLAFDTPQGRMNDEGTYVTTWRKHDGQWKAISDISTSSKPMAMPTQTATAAAMPMETPLTYEIDRAETANNTTLSWSDVTMAGFPPGAKLAVVHGDPGKSGDFTLRISYPDGYRIPPHTHPEAEHVTVLQGTLLTGRGDRFDTSALTSHGPGDFVYTPAKTPHFGMARGATVIQIHGMGPHGVNVLESKP